MRVPWWMARRVLASQCMLSSLATSKSHACDRLHPAVMDFTGELAKTQPCFSLPPRNIRILGQPSEFLDLLLDMIRRARTRVFLSSLYIGTEEQYLVDALEESLRLNPELHVHVLLDFNRSTRPGPLSTASMLLPLVQSYPDRVHAHLFKSPKLKGLMARVIPRRFDEGWGTWHAKVYGVDDEVIISGANLNDSYFTNRQDRYLHFKSTSLSDYCFSFLQSVVPFCFQVRPGNQGSYELSWPDSFTSHEQIERKAEKALRGFQQRHLGNTLLGETTNPIGNVLIFPIIQAGQFNIREEERSIDLLFKHLNQYTYSTGNTPLVDLTSGYFSLSESYQKLIRDSPADCQILCASPKANGFFGSSGLSGRIPEGYTLLEQRFWHGITSSSRQWSPSSKHGVRLHEWERTGWTYHAKGIWVSPSTTEDPVLTLFGSTNLNSRSANLDNELAFIMVVPSGDDVDDVRELRRKLAEEVSHLRAHAVPWRGGERKVRVGTKAIVGLVGGML